MKQILTIVCKLQPTPEQVIKIEELLQAFADDCNYANQNVKQGITSKTSIQNLVYQSLREQFGLRSAKKFRCTNKTCNWHGDADVNGSEMIKLVGLSVTQPEGSKILSCNLSWDSSGLLKAPSMQERGSLHC